MKISVYVASAFSKDHKGGNKAGVVFMEHTLNTTQKLRIIKLSILHQKRKLIYVVMLQLALS